MSAESRPSLPAGIPQIFSGPLLENCLLYTSDAADE